MTEALSRKIGAGVHASWRRVFLDVLPAFTQVFRADEEFRRTMTTQFRFEEKELAYLLDADEDSKAVRELGALVGEAPKPARGGLAEFSDES